MTMGEGREGNPLREAEGDAREGGKRRGREEGQGDGGEGGRERVEEEYKIYQT